MISYSGRRHALVRSFGVRRYLRADAAKRAISRATGAGYLAALMKSLLSDSVGTKKVRLASENSRDKAGL